MTLNLPRTVRSIRRVQHIATVLTRHGFGHLVDRLRLERYVPLPKFWRRKPEAGSPAEPEPSLGRRLTAVFEELGPTFIKLGQTMSTRPDLFPPEIIRELILLQDRVPPFDTAIAREVIAHDLGAPATECFATFADAPFASGSIAQVYRATTRPTTARPSQSVVVKVKRPDIEDMVRLDMTILRWIADLAERLVPELQAYRPRLIVDEFERTLLREMDFVNEAATIARFSDAFIDWPGFHIPEVHWEMTGPSVLTLEEIRGISVQKLLVDDDPHYDRKAVAARLAQAFVRQFFEVGIFHADPHPGNLLIQPPARIGLIDFGLTGRIDEELLGHLVVALIAAFSREPEMIVEVLADMNALGEATDRTELRHDFLQLIEKYYGLPLHRFDPQTLFFEITGLIRRHDVTLPREFVMFGKALVSIGGVCLQLDPELNLLGLIEPKLKRIIAQRFRPSRMLKSAAISGWHIINLLRSAPGQLRDISRRLARGRWQINIRHQNLDDLAHELDRASNRLSFAIVTAAIIIASSMIITAEHVLPILNIRLPVLGFVGYLIAGVMGVGLLIAMLRSGKLS